MTIASRFPCQPPRGLSSRQSQGTLLADSPNRLLSCRVRWRESETGSGEPIRGGSRRKRSLPSMRPTLGEFLDKPGSRPRILCSPFGNGLNYGVDLTRDARRFSCAQNKKPPDQRAFAGQSVNRVACIVSGLCPAKAPQVYTIQAFRAKVSQRPDRPPKLFRILAICCIDNVPTDDKLTRVTRTQPLTWR